MEYFENFDLVNNIGYLFITNPLVFRVLHPVFMIIIIMSGLVSLFSNMGSKFLVSTILAVMVVFLGLSITTRNISFTGNDIEKRISSSQLNENQKISLNNIYSVCEEKMPKEKLIVLQKNLEIFLSKEKELETSKKDEYINLIIKKEKENTLAIFEEPTKEDNKLNKIYYLLVAIFILLLFKL